MFNWKYRYCKARMTAFIHGELPPGAQQRMARYIDECPRCYAEYVHHRELAGELKRSLPAMGRAQSPQLSRIWESIQSELSSPRMRPRRAHSASYGLVVLVLVLSLLVPFIIGQETGRLSVPSQPAPKHIVVTDAPTEAVPTVVAVRTEDARQITIVLLQNTPEARISTR